MANGVKQVQPAAAAAAAAKEAYYKKQKQLKKFVCQGSCGSLVHSANLYECKECENDKIFLCFNCLREHQSSNHQEEKKKKK